jgi:hypothetical protein
MEWGWGVVLSNDRTNEVESEEEPGLKGLKGLNGLKGLKLDGWRGWADVKGGWKGGAGALWGGKGKEGGSVRVMHVASMVLANGGGRGRKGGSGAGALQIRKDLHWV